LLLPLFCSSSNTSSIVKLAATLTCCVVAQPADPGQFAHVESSLLESIDHSPVSLLLHAIVRSSDAMP